MPLVILFGIFAFLGLLLILVGIGARNASPAPSMYRDDISPIGWTIFIICGLIAVTCYVSFAP